MQTFSPVVKPYLENIDFYADEQIFKMFSGSCVPVDPVDAGEMVLANRAYFERCESQARAARMALQELEIKDLNSLVCSHDLRIEKLEASDGMLLSLIESTFDIRRNAKNSIAGLGASTLKGLATALWTIPGINLVYGAASYGAGSLLEWYSDMSCDLSIKENFSQART